MTSQANVWLLDSSTVDGFVKTAGMVERQNGVTVVGPTLEEANPVFGPFQSPVVTFPDLVTDIILEPEQPEVPLGFSFTDPFIPHLSSAGEVPALLKEAWPAGALLQ